jgi:hypothetical protein
MKKKQIIVGTAGLLTCLSLLAACGTTAKKEDKLASSSTSKSTKQSSSEVQSSSTSESSEPVETDTTTTELTTLEATVQGKIALALAKMQSVAPDQVDLDRIKTEAQLTFTAQNSSFGYTEYFIANGALNSVSSETIGGYAYCLIIRDDSFVQYGTQGIPAEDPATTNPVYYFKDLTPQEIELAMTLKDKIVIR